MHGKNYIYLFHKEKDISVQWKYDFHILSSFKKKDLVKLKHWKDQTKTTECRSEKYSSCSTECFATSCKIALHIWLFLKEFCKNCQNNPQNNLAILSWKGYIFSWIWFFFQELHHRQSELADDQRIQNLGWSGRMSLDKIWNHPTSRKWWHVFQNGGHFWRRQQHLPQRFVSSIGNKDIIIILSHLQLIGLFWPQFPITF